MAPHEMNTEGTLVWAAPGSSASRPIVETAASELNLAVHFCAYKELLELLRTERCHVACIELGFDVHPGLTLLKSVSERMPRLTTVVASSDASVSMIRGVLEGGAADFLSLPLNPQELSKTLIKLSQTAMKSAASRGKTAGTVITVCGARGGLGATTPRRLRAAGARTGRGGGRGRPRPRRAGASAHACPVRPHGGRHRAHGERGHAGRVRAVGPHPHPDRSLGPGGAGGPAHDRAVAARQRVCPADRARVLARDPRSREPAGRSARARQGAAPRVAPRRRRRVRRDERRYPTQRQAVAPLVRDRRAGSEAGRRRPAAQAEGAPAARVQQGGSEMKLRDRLSLNNKPVPATGRDPAPRLAAAGRLTPVDRAYQDLKLRIHRELLDRVDLTNLARVEMDQATAELKSAVAMLIEEQAVPLSLRDRERLAEEILHEVYGLGPIEPLMRDPDISDILVNTSRQVYIERLGKLEPTPVIFRDDQHLMQIIDRIVSKVGRRIDESSPMVDARLPDGSRVNAVIPPLALDGPLLSIRRFGRSALTVEDLMRLGTLTPDMVAVLRAMVRSRLNILVSGGTGSGKTTLLNCLSSFIPDQERIVTIEDSAELQLQQPHVCRLETRPPNIEGRGEVTQRDLVRNSLRMRPDRIVIGEVRGGEAIDMLQAMNTGHDGSLTTVHANSPRDALSRLETMIQMTGMRLSDRAMRQQIAAAINLVVQVARLSDGSRRVTSISEITGMEGETITMQEVFLYERTGVDPVGQVIGRFRATGIRPRFAEKLKACGLQLPRVFFEEM